MTTSSRDFGTTTRDWPTDQTPALEQHPTTTVGCRARDLVWAAVWFGLITGWAELALILAWRALDPRITMTSLRTNQYFVWMVPLYSLVLFTALGLAIGAVARVVPGVARWVSWRLFPGLAALSLLLTAEGLHPFACTALASGFGIWSGLWIEFRSKPLVRLARVSVPVLAGALAVVGIGWTAWLASAEKWKLAHLPAATPGAPNVLWIVLDTVRADSMSVFGHDRPTTPNLERLAAQAVRFTQARSPAPWTLASHASMFTGQWCHNLSVSWDRGLDTTYPTMAEYLAQRGYATGGFVGNAYYCNARYGLDRGFARYEDFYENRSASPYEVVRSTGLGRALLMACGYKIKLADWGTVRRKTAESINCDALDWIAQRPDGRPFFVFLNYNDAHSPYLVPNGPTPRFGFAARPPVERAVVYQRFQRLIAGQSLPNDGPAEQVDREGAALSRDSYESCIAYLDHQIGRLFGELEGRGLRENTIVVVTSDHGEHFRERGFLGHGLSLYRKEVHVPLMIFPPTTESVAQPVISDPVSLRDLPATVAEMLSPGTSSPFPGRSLAGLWNGTRPTPSAGHDYVLCEVERQEKYQPNPKLPATLNPITALVTGGKVYIRSGDRREELYDLENDPDETHNLIEAEAHQSMITRCRNLLNHILTSDQGVPPATLAEAETVEMRK